MMSNLTALLNACQTEAEPLLVATRERVAQQNSWLQPLAGTSPTGEDPTYSDGFQQIREEISKLSGADTALVCQLADKLLTTTTRDIRLATYYCWARLHTDGEQGLAEGLERLDGLLAHYGPALHPQRERSQKAALEWLAESRMIDSLSLHPEVVKEEAIRITGALLLLEQLTAELPEESRPQLGALYRALEQRLVSAGGVDAVVPQNVGHREPASPQTDTYLAGRITSGQELLAQARLLADYLREQPDSWLAAHHLMKSLRHDTLQTLPATDAQGRTRIAPPGADQRALLKRLYRQQSWTELRDQADSAFSRGAGHLWLDVQWYIHQALLKSGQQTLADIVAADLKGLLSRLPGLETLAFSDGTPFADEVTQNWLQQHVMGITGDWPDTVPVASSGSTEEDILALEPEAVALADSDGLEAAISWLQARPGITTPRQYWLRQLLTGRLAEQYGKNELAVHLFARLGDQARTLTLADWAPDLLFEVLSRHLKLLRRQTGNSEPDRRRLAPQMDNLLAQLIALDPARAAVLCR